MTKQSTGLHNALHHHFRGLKHTPSVRSTPLPVRRNRTAEDGQRHDFGAPIGPFRPFFHLVICCFLFAFFVFLAALIVRIGHQPHHFFLAAVECRSAGHRHPTYNGQNTERKRPKRTVCRRENHSTKLTDRTEGLTYKVVKVSHLKAIPMEGNQTHYSKIEGEKFTAIQPHCCHAFSKADLFCDAYMASVARMTDQPNDAWTKSVGLNTTTASTSLAYKMSNEGL